MKKLIALVLVLVLVFTTVACSTNTPVTENETLADNTAKTSDEAPTSDDNENYKIIFSMTDMNSAAAAYWSNLHVTLGAENGLDITLINPGGDPQLQSQQIMDAIAQGIYDVLVYIRTIPRESFPASRPPRKQA